MKKFYITTSIAYTNAMPHIGFAMESIQADVIARYHRAKGEDVFFITGTDEHGTKIAKAAKGRNPQEFVDEISKRVKELKPLLNLSNDYFIRTTDKEKHWPNVNAVWVKLRDKGDIYKKEYIGLYCSGCEAFLTKRDLIDGKCAIHKTEPEEVKEENYFFRLSKYTEKVRKMIEKDEINIIPKERKNEVLGMISQGIEDISFSRPKEKLDWGIPVPGDDTQTIYVWSDALVNYLSVLDYYNNSKEFKKYWPADVHCIGKDIIKFHCIIWPAMLLSLGLKMPKNIFVHGFITVSGQKMSKSIGNVIDPFELVNKYGTDAVRYYLLREIPPTEDGDFTYEKFEGRYNSDLAGGIGNLVSRVMKMAEGKKLKSKIVNKDLKSLIKETKKTYEASLGNFRFNDALKAIWDLISWCDKYINDKRPWEGDSIEVISDLVLAIDEIKILIAPFLPQTSEKKEKMLFPRIIKAD